MTWQHQREIVFTWERETFHGFICSWIALNAAMSARYAVGGDRAKIRLLAEELEPLWGGWLAEDAVLRDAAAELAAASPIYDERRGERPSSRWWSARAAPCQSSWVSTRCATTSSTDQSGSGTFATIVS
jgi:hypothetical protein